MHRLLVSRSSSFVSSQSPAVLVHLSKFRFLFCVSHLLMRAFLFPVCHFVLSPVCALSVCPISSLHSESCMCTQAYFSASGGVSEGVMVEAEDSAEPPKVRPPPPQTHTHTHTNTRHTHQMPRLSCICKGRTPLLF
jgi:hypothetical protein